MGLRETFRRKPKLAAGIAVGLIIAAGGLLAFEVKGSGPADGAASKAAYFTVDDGSTWFVDDSGQLPPFDYHGQKAVAAIIVDVGGKQQCAYLERYTPARIALGQAALDALKNHKAPPKAPPGTSNPFWGAEVKKPGAGNWVAKSGADGQKIMQATAGATIIAPGN